jgi:hypothetical protein
MKLIGAALAVGILLFGIAPRASAKCPWHPIYVRAHIEGFRPGGHDVSVRISVSPTKFNPPDEIRVEVPDFQTTYNFIPQGRHILGEWPERCSVRVQKVTLSLIVDGRSVDNAMLSRKDFSFNKDKLEYIQTTGVTLQMR